MITFIDLLWRVAVFATPVIALLVLIVGLMTARFRGVVIGGFVGAVIGGLFGLGISGGQDSGWGLGTLAAFGIGLVSACSGFLLGFGCMGVKHKEWRVPTIILIFCGLLMPVSGLAIGNIRPRLMKRESAIWREIIATGVVNPDINFYRSNFSPPTRRWLEERLGRTEQGLLPTSVLSVLDQLGVDVTEHPNLNEEMAWRFYNTPRNPWTVSSLARNPSIPVNLQSKIAHGDDFAPLTSLARNAKLDPSLRELLIAKLTVELMEAELAKDYGKISSCKDSLEVLGRTTNK